MGALSKLKRLLGLTEGHEDTVAEQVSKRTNVSEDQAEKGLNKAEGAAGKKSDDSGKGN